MIGDWILCCSNTVHTIWRTWHNRIETASVDGKTNQLCLIESFIVLRVCIFLRLFRCNDRFPIPLWFWWFMLDDPQYDICHTYDCVFRIGFDSMINMYIRMSVHKLSTRTHFKYWITFSDDMIACLACISHIYYIKMEGLCERALGKPVVGNIRTENWRRRDAAAAKNTFECFISQFWN